MIRCLAGIVAWVFRWVEGILYGPLWLDGSDWCGDVAARLERWRDEGGQDDD